MIATAAALPDDIATLKAMVIAGLEREARMQHILDQIRRTTFGKRSEKLSEDQLLLGLDDLDVARAEMEALAEQSPAALGQKKERTRKESGAPRASLPANPQAYLTDVLTRIVLRADTDAIDDLLPYNWVDSRSPQSEIIDQAA